MNASMAIQSVKKGLDGCYEIKASSRNPDGSEKELTWFYTPPQHNWEERIGTDFETESPMGMLILALFQNMDGLIIEENFENYHNVLSEMAGRL